MSGLGPLNLSDADTSGFEAIEAGRYNAEIFEMKMDAVKNTSGQGKLPAGTPCVKVQFKLTDEGVENRRVFAQYNLPGEGYDASKAAKMKGMFVRFLTAIGEDEAKVKSAKYNPDFEDFIGRECVVVVNKEPKKTQGGEIVEGEFNNAVKGVKEAGTLVGSGGGGLL
jgi:hypothetical protein